jgi:hypothetical protein
MPARDNGCVYSTHHTARADSLEELFQLLQRVESEAWRNWVINTSVCLDNPSGECLYVGLAGDRWTFFFLRMPEVGDGELFIRSVGDPSAEGSTQVIVEMKEDVPNSSFVPREVGMRVVREWWDSKTLSNSIGWREE